MKDSEAKPAIKGKAAVNIDGVISEVSADGKSFKVGDLWVNVTPAMASCAGKKFKNGFHLYGLTKRENEKMNN